MDMVELGQVTKQAIVLTALVLLGGAAFAAKAPHATRAARATTASAPASAPGTLLNEVVAVANDQPILLSSVDEETRQVRKALQAQGTPIPAANVLRHQILEHLITQSLELQAAQQQGVQVSDDDVNAALSDVAQRNGLTLAQLPQALATEGENYAAFRSIIRNQLTIHRLEQQVVASNIMISPSEVQNYLQTERQEKSSQIQYHIAQILVAFPSNPSPAQAKATLAKSEQILAKLRKGANFAATAVAESAGPHALNGGDIGWLKGADLPTMFSDVVPSMTPGGISDPIEGPDGYHIVKLIASRQPQQQSMKTEYHVEQIMLRPNPVRNLKQAKALAEQLRSEIESGKLTFAAAAKQYSDDPNSAGSGGDLNWVRLSELPPRMADAVVNLPLNTVSQPVRTRYGWHLVEVSGKRQVNESEAEQENEAYQAIFQRKLQDQIAQFKRSLRDQAYIRIIDPAAAGSGAQPATVSANGG